MAKFDNETPEERQIRVQRMQKEFEAFRCMNKDEQMAYIRSLSGKPLKNKKQ